MNAKFLRLSAAFLFVFGAIACGKAEPPPAPKPAAPAPAPLPEPVKQGNPGVIKIVSSLPRTGSARGQTDTIVNGIRMAIEEAGAKVRQFHDPIRGPRRRDGRSGDLDRRARARQLPTRPSRIRT
jgi:hypothetical protein